MKLLGEGLSVRRLFVAAMLLTLSVAAQAQESVLVAGGAGYKRPIEEIANGFEAKSKVKVERVYGNMGQVLAQVKAGNKVAIVFGEQVVLEAAGQVSFSKFLPLGSGRLVLAWPKGKTIKAPSDIATDGFARIGLPDTKQAIFGKAAIEFLQHSGLYGSVEKRLLVVATVPQVSAYLVSGEVDAGFINLTEAQVIRDKIGGFVEIPATEYSPIHISAGLVSGQDSPAVKALTEYLQTPAAQEVFKRYGL